MIVEKFTQIYKVKGTKRLILLKVDATGDFNYLHFLMIIDGNIDQSFYLNDKNLDNIIPSFGK